MSLVVMATGGTGGHIYPAVATARELSRRGHEVLLLGQRGGMEERVSREQGLPFEGVDAGKLARSGQGRPDPRELLRAGQGVLQARSVLNRLKPGVVVGYGGFASLPGVLAAQSLGVPTVLHEQNARLGLTQRLAVRKARAVGTAYERVIGLDAQLATMVGMPVREERLPRAEALARLGLQEGPLTIFVMGGSQGSLFLNQTVPDVLRHVFGPEGLLPPPAPGVVDLDFTGVGRGGVQVLHSTGPRWIAEVAPGVRDLEWFEAAGYVDAVAAWSVADLAITRAGTSTLAEAAFHGVPLVMVPLPESAENHQFHNAQAVQAAGAGVVVEQRSASEALGRAVLECAAAGTRASMREAALGRAQTGAAGRFADLIERHLR
ncbi:undecaprenyldiphospho-muramoylpentapeptide beta-N-acetylglucosaminyltransferase [Deinococcus soli (ex Cha et al. 2016)]|uniref:UDP-N-acetylglucosamine--N-acetylmuramyl-(pentapeptide) pyrophosphoryl-undecaprenol N-acetylglucosamine transferase n=2 Tax=Deinococcus soli (ex Cha et al. 2016) TaxID=1309411 RepID=A0AAE3XB71_9DEIO|nr:undecaprenyldiphospho-muramoylpentapeptide beta-N-acetylglucosaminyltransferase [Deinococcus soli (ex Cha et al. 2016)]MDR6216538.1 UDP-N-acetylglucosamine--N-acetylmuramyl-(pentapeptide) pyrophosphoryl-undecaprenol N-acetylglucosamine transferase [Deinococcus soli (ex Cha et al. 2016)]MDR6327359.1 UDP-N-acetylglucosamine--N-acetylmuramyl-(pentapeptide) pyrophosphoryl-undecaprenol N-acetylglucosamine transferase [Deinococcus soli (ex Cha et al. 2016)]MDR6749634.1 UDP-N-acetylglucosamine--N-ac